MLLTNSWLYHYYSVQSKIQFGLSFDPQQQQQHQQQPPQQQQQPTSPRLSSAHHYHHPQFYPATPIPPQALNHHHHLPYGSPHYSYGYQTHHQSGGSNGAAGGQQTHHNSHIIMNLNGYEAQVKTTTDSNNIVASAEDRPKSPTTAIATTTTTAVTAALATQAHPHPPPPPSSKRRTTELSPSSNKKRAISRLEPIYIPDQSQNSPEEPLAMTELRNGFGASENSNQTVILGTISYGRPRTKFVGKLHTTPVMDSTEFIEQWNPSPPWSETAQKVPDMCPQELSPYMTTTTPPTPNSANIIAPTAVNATHLSSVGMLGGHGGGGGGGAGGPKSVTNGSLSGHGSAFNFDWVPEQFVPVATGDCSIAPLPPPPSINCVSFLPSSQEISGHHHPHRTFSHWPATTTTPVPVNHNPLHLYTSSGHLGYEEHPQLNHHHHHHHHHLPFHSQQTRMMITGDSLATSGDKSSNSGRNNGKDSSDDDRVGSGRA